MIFKDRIDAGQQLGQALLKYKTGKSLVLGLTRGGIPVANQVAKVLQAPLGAICVRKLGVPSYPELGAGAIAPGVESLNEDLIKRFNIPESALDEVRRREENELKRQMLLYTGQEELPELKGKTVFIIDDGVATGGSLRAAIFAVKQVGASKVIAAVPVGAPESVIELTAEVNHFICLYEPMDFMAVGSYYYLFDQVTDREVIETLAAAKK